MNDSGTIEIRLQPRANRDEIVGERNGRLLIRLTAPPLEGRANEALCRLIAKRAGVPRSRVSIIRGERGPDKVVRVDGVGDEQLRLRLVS